MPRAAHRKARKGPQRIFAGSDTGTRITDTSRGLTVSEAGPSIGPSQIKALQGHARRGGADLSEQRAALWGHLLNLGGPVPTKSLTESEGRLLADTLSAMSTPDLQAAVASATAPY